jgi:hypothetical protein
MRCLNIFGPQIQAIERKCFFVGSLRVVPCPKHGVRYLLVLQKIILIVRVHLRVFAESK